MAVHERDVPAPVDRGRRAMCASAISQARIARLYYGASDPKSGGIEQGPRLFSHPQSHNVPEIYGGIGAPDAEALLQAFFADKRG